MLVNISRPMNHFNQCWLCMVKMVVWYDTDDSLDEVLNV